MKIKKQSGFTLIELMVVVAIIGILSAIVYPSYVKSVQKSKRSDAKIELLRIAQMQESYFAQNMSYAKDLTQLGLSANTIASEQNEYNVTVANLTPAACTGDSATPCVSFTLSAVPSGSQANDTDCLGFTLASSGRKGITVANASAQAIRSCWK